MAAMAETALPHTWADVKALVDDRPPGTIAALSRYLDIDSSQVSRSLKEGRGELKVAQAMMVLDFINGIPRADRDVATPAASDRRLRTYGFAAANDSDRFMLSPGSELDPAALPPGIDLDPDTHFVVKVPGSWMEPRVFPGELVIARRNLPPGRDKTAVVEFMDGWGLLMNYRARRDGRVFGEIFNPQQLVDFDATTVRALHAVIVTI